MQRSAGLIVLTASSLLACVAGCAEPKPTASSSFKIARVPQANTGDKELDDAVNAALQPLADYDFKSKAAVSWLVDRLDLVEYMNGAPHGQIVAELTAALSVTRTDNGDGTQTVTVGVRTKTPEIAGHIVNAAVDHFTEQLQSKYRTAVQQAVSQAVAKERGMRDRVIQLEQRAVRVELGKEAGPNAAQEAADARAELTALAKQQATMRSAFNQPEAAAQAMKFAFTQRAQEMNVDMDYQYRYR